MPGALIAQTCTHVPSEVHRQRLKDDLGDELLTAGHEGLFQLRGEGRAWQVCHVMVGDDRESASRDVLPLAVSRWGRGAGCWGRAVPRSWAVPAECGRPGGPRGLAPRGGSGPGCARRVRTRAAIGPGGHWGGRERPRHHLGRGPVRPGGGGSGRCRPRRAGRRRRRRGRGSRRSWPGWTSRRPPGRGGRGAVRGGGDRRGGGGGRLVRVDRDVLVIDLPPAILHLDRYADELLAVSDVPGVEAVLAIRQVGGDGTLVGDASIGVSSDRGEIRVLKVLVVHEDRHGLARGEAGEVDIEGLGVIWLVLNDGWD